MSKWFKFNGRHNNIYFLRFSSIERKQIPIVPKILHDYLFNDIPTNPLDKKRYKIEDIKIPTLPKLYCEGNILKHFELLGEKFNKNYDNYLIKAFLTKEIPPMPKEWAFIEGWVKYENDKPIKVG